MNQYVVYHLHSDLSNCVTNIDSVTKYQQYISRAQELGMQALGFSEHGSVLGWLNKKNKIEAAGMKYIHGAEVYVTQDKIQTNPEEEIQKNRDNYHCVLMAKNYDGFKEINKLVSQSFNRNDGHYYYNPRITFDDVLNTSDNIIITSACLGGIIAKGDEEIGDKFIDFMSKNQDRCFLEIQHHNVNDQILYNKRLYNISKQTGIRLIAGTDTHCLNERHAFGRKMLQQGKKVFFEGEDNWDLTFKSYDELVEAYRVQDGLPESVYLEAIENTNLLLEMVEPFEIDTNFKYPKIYENSEEVFEKKVYEKAKNHKYLTQRYDWETVKERLDSEISVYKAVRSCDFMLLQDYLRDWEHANDIWCGPSRGSVSGSLVAYALGITEMDSIKYDLNFFRFMSADRISLADIDTDYAEKDRERVKYFILHDHLNLPTIKSSEIVTFNTVALKGSIRDACRAFDIPLDEVSEICEAVYKDEEKKDAIDDIWRQKYPQVFEIVDLIMGTIVSMGSHPSGVLVSDLNIAEEIGLCSTAGSEFPVSCLNMKELDSLNYVKLDILGLDNVGVINSACKLAGIERLTPDNIDLNDWNVWKSISEDTLGVFQWESPFAAQTLKSLFSDDTINKIKQQIPDISYLKLFSFGNALIRPCGASVRNDAIHGKSMITGISDIDTLLSQELGYCIIQEDIMKFLVAFCGYSMSEADKARKIIGKKLGTQQLLPEIKKGFFENAVVRYNLSEDKANEIIEPILQCVLDASRYAFSWNHSDSYSCIGYICGYLKYYYPLEFLTACFNELKDSEGEFANLTNYANLHKVPINEPRFRYSKADYFLDKNTNSIYKGMESIKYLNRACANELYNLREFPYNTFTDLLYDIKNISVDARQLGVLIKLDFFSEFGNSKELLRINDMFEYFKCGDAKNMKKEKLEKDQVLYDIVSRHSRETDKSFLGLETYNILKECEEYLKCQNIQDFSYKDKILTQNEYLGYINLCSHSQDESERRKLIVLDVKTLLNKFSQNKKEVWKYNIKTQSLGSGKLGSFYIAANLFENEPIEKYDIVFADRVFQQKGYWNIGKYHHV